MSQINDVNIRSIPDNFIMSTPKWLTEPPTAVPIYPPVTDVIGIPIVDVPGCVESHRDSSENLSLKDEDPDGVIVICDAGVPSFNAVDYDPNKLDIKRTYENNSPVPPYKPPPNTTPKTPTPKTPKAKKPDCPSDIQALQEPVGKVIGDEVVIEHRLVPQGNSWVCVTVKRQIDIPTQIIENIPSAGAVTATASIAVVATTSALLAKPLADLLLKAVKPTVKKVMKKIAVLRGKKIPVQSLRERVAEQRQRNHALKLLRSVRPLKK
tara:strand:+ start:60 stop:857 length:798 start_codon:yes stop_codon:yes gene_type:complete